MRKLIIQDVGPIFKSVEIEFNRFCILIGPQSNGKSTIAKILSTCMWIEKEACTSLSEPQIPDGKAFVKLVEDFHRMHNYIHSDRSYIYYESPYVSITYDKGEYGFSFKNNEAYQRNKISYIPSDRNVVTMKDIEKRDLEPTNFRSFLFDWLDTAPKFDATHMTPILNLGVKYYFDSQKDERRDMLMHENGVTYAIPLYDASSGMQSIVPMMVLVHYLVNDYFKNYDKDQSFEQSQKRSALLSIISKRIIKQYYPEVTTEEAYRTILKEKILNKKFDGDKTIETILNEIEDFYEKLYLPKTISFIIEEPEQNLFPQTQVDVFNDIIAQCNGENLSSAFITTHSPYVLAAANIMLFAGKIEKKGVDKKTVEMITKTSTVLKEEDFTAYSISDGTCKSLIDSNTGLIKENELDSASDYNANVFDQLYQEYIKSMKS